MSLESVGSINPILGASVVITAPGMKVCWIRCQSAKVVGILINVTDCGI